MAEFFTCTKNIFCLVILGFMVNYMLRINISIAIVEMIDTNINETEPTKFSIFPTTTKMNWTIIQKNDLLGSFFWGYMLSELPGGRMSEIFGPRKVFGIGMLLASILTMLMPTAAQLHFYFACTIRFLVGVALGVSLPASLPLAVKWLPPSDRSKFVSSISALAMGVALTMQISGYLISWFGWGSVFYVTGLLGLVWSSAWFYLIYDCPETHPRISEEEKINIKCKMYEEGYVEQIIPKRTPWIKMFTSIRVHAIMVTYSCVGFCHFTIINQLPTYMKDILHFNIKHNGLLSSLPFLGYYFVSVTTCYIADKLFKSKTLSKTTIRKIFEALATYTAGLAIGCLPIWGNNATVCVIIFITAYSALGATYAGHMSSSLDIAPNFSATITGAACTVGTFFGYVSTKMVAYFTQKSNTFESWNNIFWIMCGAYFFGGTFFILFSSGKVQKWNSSEVELTRETDEKYDYKLLPINPNDIQKGKECVKV